MTLRRVSLVRYIAFASASFVATLLQSGIMSEGQGGGASRVWAADADPVTAALERAGGNRAEIAGALERAPADHRDSMRFLIENMPDRDLKELKAEFLLENVRLAHEALDKAPWKASVPRDVFLNNVLPYANINERRDDWRADFIKRFGPLVAEAKTPGQAAAILNQKIFGMVNVRYSTGRPKADQSPFESMKAGLASCSGLTVLLIDACRAVGVPARFVGTPLWSDKSGNHSWVEVWDDGWHFTGAAEPAGDKLDDAWFIGRASTAQRDHRLHAIYAVSFKKTPITFPLVWDRSIDYVHAVNVTDRYAGKAPPLADGFSAVMFKVVDGAVGNRCAAKLTVRDAAGKVVFEGTSKDERFDANDHVTVPLKAGEKYQVEAQSDSGKKSTAVAEPDAGKKANGVVTIKLDP